MEVKLCKDCEHYLLVLGHRYCGRALSADVSLVDGSVTTIGHKDCRMERYPDRFDAYIEFYCGREAKYFQPKE